jgi:serine/threonine protein phosphatase PrpC
MVTMMTHCGAVRTNNEDALVVGAATVAGPSMPDPVTIQLPVRTSAVVAIADGIGGHVAGEISSACAVRRLAERSAELTGPTEIIDLLDRINDQLYDLAERRPEYRGTGTTIVGLLFSGPDTYWFNVGDSRVYREGDGYLGQLSVDDTASLTGEPGERHSGGIVITQALGGGAAYTAIDPHIAPDPVAGPARWLLCSDGLSDMVSIEKIEEILATATDDNHAVKSLWTAAMNAGGWDNITIALVGRPEAVE